MISMSYKSVYHVILICLLFLLFLSLFLVFTLTHFDDTVRLNSLYIGTPVLFMAEGRVQYRS